MSFNQLTPNDRAVTAPTVRRLRICCIVPAASTIQVVYRGRLEYFQARGFDVTVVCPPSHLDEAIRSRGVHLHTAPIVRAISPLSDLRAILKLWRFLRRERFDLVEVGMPKSALVGSIAARLARAPCLVHVVHGLAHEGQAGLLRWLLYWAARVPFALAHANYSVSAAARDAAYADGLCAPGGIRVLGLGSFSGVDLEHFHPDQKKAGPSVRARFGLPLDACVVGFVGRFSREKGLVELVRAFDSLANELPQARLLVVGDYEHRQRPPLEVTRTIANDPRVCHVPWVDDPAPLYAAMDIVVLPSHREGFGQVLLEAAAMSLPTVASTAGCREAIVPDVTGLLFPAGDATALCSALRRLCLDPQLRAQFGAAGRAWVSQHFDQPLVWAQYVAEYRRLANPADQPGPDG